MKRKKILALLMVAALCVGTVAGCGSKDTESSKSESGKNENRLRISIRFCTEIFSHIHILR